MPAAAPRAAAGLCTLALLAGAACAPAPAPAAAPSTAPAGTPAANAAAGGTGEVEVPLAVKDSGCDPQALSVPAGAVTFVITNAASDTVELEILSGDRMVSEAENVPPGFVKRLRTRLDGGAYTLLCGSKTGPQGTLTVRGGAAPTAAPKPGVDQARLAAATATYKQYVQSEVDQLVEGTDAFTRAVADGNLAEAQRLYAPTRAHYERIEPIAELFADLDGAIDARVDDYSGPDDPDFTGFHRLEKGLFADRSTAGLQPFATRLNQDVRSLQAQVNGLSIPPGVMLKGAGDLIEEVSQGKITGEEERYSHTDLSDFDANVVGSRKIFELARPLLESADPALMASIDAGFAQLDSSLAKYRLPDGTYEPYDKLTQEDKQAMQAVLAKLAEDLARVPGTLGTE